MLSRRLLVGPLAALALGMFVLGFSPSRTWAGPPDGPIPSAANPTMTLAVDAADVPRKILHAHLTVPVRPGSLTLVYPKWIPGEHGPTGPIDNVAGLHFMANGQPVPWRRDLVDMYAFHCVVPSGATVLQISLDYLSPSDTGGFSSAASATANLIDLNWNQLLLYPQGKKADEINVAASLRLPAGWQFGTALPVAGQSADTISFQPVPLVTLIDSPVIAGAYFKAVPLTAPGVTPAHEIDMVSDSAAALDMSAEQVAAYKNLVVEAGALFGARHYRDYHFLYTLSDHVARFGLEHHESSDDRVRERTLLNDPRTGSDDLLAHEFVHSWNGKFRRPADLATADYQQPMQTDLLWVYEGMTEYWGKVLTARSGLWNPEDFRSDLADLAAYLDHRPGRQWRSLQDTADAAQLLYDSPDEWSAERRGTDFYDESVLIWLEADALIRRQTGGQRSLDDFCRRFHGGQSGLPMVKPYTFDEVVATLNAVTPSDWRGFLLTRLNATGPHAPLAGLAGSGWKLVYTDQESDRQKSTEARRHYLDVNYSLGMTLGEEGRINDVIPGMPGAEAGLAPGMTILGVNGRRFTNEGLLSALRAGKTAGQALELIVENGDFLKTCTLNYRGGLLYPHLERDPSRPDLLAAIIAPRVRRPAAAAPKAGL